MLGHYQPTSETPFQWCFAGGAMMAHFKWYLDPLYPHHLKKQKSELDLLWQDFLDPSLLSAAFIYLHNLCMQEANAQTRLHIHVCAGSSEYSQQLSDGISWYYSASQE